MGRGFANLQAVFFRAVKKRLHCLSCFTRRRTLSIRSRPLEGVHLRDGGAIIIIGVGLDQSAAGEVYYYILFVAACQWQKCAREGTFCRFRCFVPRRSSFVASPPLATGHTKEEWGMGEWEWMG
jgi:hypothetical protein